jgi:hypothetical protein
LLPYYCPKAVDVKLDGMPSGIPGLGVVEVYVKLVETVNLAPSRGQTGSRRSPKFSMLIPLGCSNSNLQYERKRLPNWRRQIASNFEISGPLATKPEVGLMHLGYST